MGCLSGCLSCINKTFLYVLNLLLFLIGLAVVVIASITLSKGSEWDLLLQDGIFTLPVIVLCVGIFVLLLGFFGCCGAKKENSCMLYTYSGVLLVLVIAQLTCGILLLVYKEDAEDFVMGGFSDVFDKYNSTIDPELTHKLDNLQHNLECCGVKGPDFWKNETLQYMDNLSVPDSCCKSWTLDCGKDFFDHANPDYNIIYDVGCYTEIKEELLSLGLGISGLVLAAAGIQLIIVVLACCLAQKGGKKSSEYA